MAAPIRIPGLDLDLAWHIEPPRWQVAERSVTIEAGPRCDYFQDPGTGEGSADAPALLAELPPGDQQLSAHVRVGFRDTFDAGVLLVWADEQRFAKLCFERSPAGQPMVVTVVTRGVSDDANAYVVDGDEHWLRISTLGPAIAFHASADGQRWSMVRYFDLGADEPIRVGFEAQSPTGEGCEVVFSDITLRQERLADLRDGS